jgi:hypothetical protein
MSSNTTLEATTFEPLRGAKTYGFRMYDDYSKTYDNNSSSLIVDDMELLEYAIGCGDSEVTGMIEFLSENEQGMTINGTWYDYEEIKIYFP